MIQIIKAFVRRLLGKGAPPAKKAEPARTARRQPEQEQEPAAAPQGSVLTESTKGGQRAAALDKRVGISARLKSEEQLLLKKIEGRIESGRFDLPQLPSTSMQVMSLANDPRTDIAEITKLISGDPALSGQLLQTANSALYGGRAPATSIQDAVMRVGMRALRTLVLSASMKGVMLTGKGVASYGKSVWRQSLSVAHIAAATGPLMGIESNRAFLIGLLHDIGKLPLLAMLDNESRRGFPVSQALIGKVFQLFHESVGGKLADTWQLGDELVSVSGMHHSFQENEDHPRAAAFASLAHKLDLYQSLRDDRGFDALLRTPEMDVLELPDELRRQILNKAQAAYGDPGQALAA